MADLSKADKIAAGKQKLKAFQQRSRKSDPQSKKHGSQESVASIGQPIDILDTNISPLIEINPEIQNYNVQNVPESFTQNDILTASVDSSSFFDIGVNNGSNNVGVPSIQSYFNDNSLSYGNFDQVFQNLSGPVLKEQIDEADDAKPVEVLSRSGYEKSFESSSLAPTAPELSIVTNQEEVSFLIDPVPLAQFQNNEFSAELIPQEKPLSAITVSSNNPPTIESTQQDETELIPTEIPFQHSQTETLPIEILTPQHDRHSPNQIEPSVSIQPSEYFQPPEVPMYSSNIENLTQISNALKNFIEPTNETPTSELSYSPELEKRNQELAGLLNNRNIENEALKTQSQEYVSRIRYLEEQLNNMAAETTVRVHHELQPLKEQLEYQAKSIGMLVGERAELTAAVEKCQAIIKEKISENEEINCKLRASRHKANDLEREMSNLKSNLDIKLQHETQGNINQLQETLHQSNKRNEELNEDITELTQKLSAKSQECQQVRQELAEKMNLLSISEVKLQQLCNNETTQLESQVDYLSKEKFTLDLKINHLSEELKSLSLEKEKSNEQYQHYVTQLNDQIKQFSTQNDYLTGENTRLQKREADLINHIGNLEKDLQILHGQKTPTHKDSKEFQELLANIGRLEKIIEDTNRDMGNEIAVLHEEKKDLIAELDLRNKTINELEDKIVEMETDRPDAVRLVAAMESDKVAAAQAIKQNTKLKKEVEELQDKFVEFTDRELKLTGKLESEQHLGQEILKQLKTRENEIENLTQQLRDKDAKIIELQKFLDKAVSNETVIISNEPLITPPITESLQTSERNGETPEPIKEKQETQESTNTFTVKNCENCKQQLYHLEMTEAQQKLEERFKRTMEDIARLTDEKLELEHLVMQLQGETETIGEYIALYQYQRSILNQRSKEKDEELRLLNADRKHIKEKLDELNRLVEQFVPDKMPSSELLEECQKLTNEVPEDQTQYRVDKIREIISEIHSSNLIDPKGVYCAHACSYCSGQLITV